MTDTSTIAARYQTFADQQAAGVSPTFEAWARAVADDSELLSALAALPVGKQQPNLVFAAARLHGAIPGNPTDLRDTLLTDWQTIRATLLARSTQTNEAARCAALLLGLQQVDGPVALLEVGASAGLCLIPDRYSYSFSDGSRLDPADGASALTIPIRLYGGLTPPYRMPQIVWRAGLDLNPLDPGDPGDLAWLEALVWPEHDDRRLRLVAAARLAAAEGLEVRRGDLLGDLAPLAAEAPGNAMLVITHSATLTYLDEAQRGDAIDTFDALPGRRIGFEARGVDPSVQPPIAAVTPQTLYVVTLDGRPYALADGHGSHLSYPGG